MSEQPNIVLVHGAWADGSSWSGVIRLLQKAGYNVAAPQFPLTALADNVARLRQVLAAQTGPTLVAGHSYGCQIMTALGADAPNVSGWCTSRASPLMQVNRFAGCSRKVSRPRRWRIYASMNRASP